MQGNDLLLYSHLLLQVDMGCLWAKKGKHVRGTQGACSVYQGHRPLGEPVEKKCSRTFFTKTMLCATGCS